MKGNSDKQTLGPVHIWALGVGIVLVGEFMGWNLTILRGGSIGSLISIWTIALLYIALVMMTTEMSSVMPEAGGQYTIAKYTLGPLAAFNVGLMLVLEYVMLEAADALVVGQILSTLHPEIQSLPYVILSLLILTYINYRGAHVTLTLNFFITGIAFISVLVLLFATSFYDPQATLIRINELTDGLPYGFLGILAAMQFAVWFFLGIEGTALASNECRSVNRSLPLGTMIGLATLLIGGTITWFVCSGLVPAGVLGHSAYPLFEAALATGKLYAVVALFVGTVLACLASANGCINDASRAWSALSADSLLPNIFAKKHPRYHSPYRSIIFLLPISAIFAFTGLLDQIVTFSIFSALLVYLLTCLMMFRFRKMYPLGTIKRGYVAPFHPLPSFIVGVLTIGALFGMHMTYWIDMIAGVVFYTFASIWFVVRRSKYIDGIKYLEAGMKKWGQPQIGHHIFNRSKTSQYNKK